MEHKITHRAARKEDAPLIAKAVAMAFGDECVKALCGDDYLNVLEDIAKSEDSQYSFKNALIAEVDGLPAGAICGYDGGELSKLKARTLEMVKEHTGLEAQVEKETQAGEFYIDSLGILPEYRGQGLGSKLLTAMCDHANKNGHSLVGLLVDYNNPKAEALYKKLGFKRIETVDFLGHKMWHLQIHED